MAEPGATEPVATEPATAEQAPRPPEPSEARAADPEPAARPTPPAPTTAPASGRDDPVAARLRELRQAAEDAGRWEEVEALGAALRSHLQAVQAEGAADVIELGAHRPGKR